MEDTEWVNALPKRDCVIPEQDLINKQVPGFYVKSVLGEAGTEARGKFLPIKVVQDLETEKLVQYQASPDCSYVDMYNQDITPPLLVSYKKVERTDFWRITGCAVNFNEKNTGQFKPGNNLLVYIGEEGGVPGDSTWHAKLTLHFVINLVKAGTKVYVLNPQTSTLQILSSHAAGIFANEGDYAENKGSIHDAFTRHFGLPEDGKVASSCNIYSRDFPVDDVESGNESELDFDL